MASRQVWNMRLSSPLQNARKSLESDWGTALVAEFLRCFPWCLSSRIEKLASSMFCPLKLILMPVLLDYSLGLNDLIELTVHVGDSALLGCVFQITEEKCVTKVDWMFSSGEHAKDDYVLYYYANLSVPVGRFQNRVSLVGDILRNDGSLLLQNVEEADQGTYTCEIRLEKESLVFKKAVALHVLPEEPKELTVHVGDSTQLGCVFQSTEEKRMTRVDWTFSSGEHTKEEVVLRYYPKPSVPVGYFQGWGRFQNRVTLVGDTSYNDASILLQGVKESDRGSYTCSIHLGNLTFRKTTVLRVIVKEPQTSVTPLALRPEILGGNQLVIIVGIVCGTILLLPVLILIVKRTHRNKSSALGQNRKKGSIFSGRCRGQMVKRSKAKGWEGASAGSSGGFGANSAWPPPWGRSPWSWVSLSFCCPLPAQPHLPRPGFLQHPIPWRPTLLTHLQLCGQKDGSQVIEKSKLSSPDSLQNASPLSTSEMPISDFMLSNLHNPGEKPGEHKEG